LIPVQARDPAKGKIMADFLKWMLDDGQKMTTELTYAPLPATVVAKVKDEIKQVR
jgi:phosphate transport system substrate-binding protein